MGVLIDTCIWIASQAVQHGLSLLTRNAADFEDIPGLELLALELD